MLDINKTDPDALAKELRDAMRREDVCRILTACEALLRDLCDCGHDRVFAEDAKERTIPQVRQAMRWVVDTLQGLQIGHWSGGVMEQAVRAANLARLLPNPQPMDCRFCKGLCKGPFNNISHVAPVPAPTHALRLYVDALMLAKGEGWHGWLRRAVPKGWTVSDVANRLWFGKHCRIDTDGSIECGEHCPQLPEVTL